MAVSPTTLDAEIYARDGVILLRDALDAELIERAATEYREKPCISETLPYEEPFAVHWVHAPGNRKRARPLAEMPAVYQLAKEAALLASLFAEGPLRLFETGLFDKPPGSGPIHWHHDLSFCPFDPGDQLSVWIPLDIVTKESGAICYSLGSHKRGARASVDLATGKKFGGDRRNPISPSPDQVRCMEMGLGDVVIHDGKTWHSSGPNMTLNNRLAISIRLMSGLSMYQPGPGSAPAFVRQMQAIGLTPGQLIVHPAFPVIA